MKVLLLYPNLHGMNMLPPAIALFSSLLKMHGHTVDLFDSTNWLIPGEDNFNSDKEKERFLTAKPFDDSKLRSQIRQSNVFDDFRQKVVDFGPDLIAVSVSEDIFPIGIRLLRVIRDFNIPTIMGGVFPTFAPEKCLSHDEVDIVCIGEGEYALVELCDRMDKGESYYDISNLWIKTSNGIIKNVMGPPANIDENPILDLSLFEESRLYRPMDGKVWRMLPVETHRGCPYQCTYCNSPSQRRLYYKETKCNQYRKKSFEAIYKELKYFKEDMKAEALYFWADTFLTYTDREFHQFCEMYEDIKLPFWCQSRPETVRVDRIKKLMNLGLFRMAFGIEHGNHEFRKKILRRNMSNKVIINNLAILNKLGLPYSVNNIIGFTTETRSLAMDTIEINRRVKSDCANAYSFSPFHGTVLRKMAEELGYCDPNLIARSAMKPTLLKMPQFPPHEIEGLRRCFTFYVHMPKSKWPDIAKAEKLTPEGEAIWEELREECLTHYMSII
ncbi:MAG: B12-binding domain-containing radical SAM protein [Deltaproteobacteria bacterium]|nr:B12-binding domain-containing radical SAM protein [Deltaproteobacteria bacterium]